MFCQKQLNIFQKCVNLIKNNQNKNVLTKMDKKGVDTVQTYILIDILSN